MADALRRKIQHILNVVVITQLSLLKELHNLGVPLASHRQTKHTRVSIDLTTLHNGDSSKPKN